MTARPGNPLSRPAGGGSAAGMVGAGILVSRLLGLVRQRVFAFYLGTSDSADAFAAAFRIPNMLQNLLGEGVLSASLIPVYSGLKARGEDEARRTVASAVLAILSLVTAVVVLLGILLAPQITGLIAVGYEGAKLELTTRLVRVLFPGAGLLVLSAWCLGVLNAHGRFFLAYASAALWNVAMIATLLFYGDAVAQEELVGLLAWGSVAGCVLQLAAQAAAVRTVLGGLRRQWDRHRSHVRAVVANFGPVFVGRGVTQLSGFIDTMIASLPVLGTGAQVTLNYAQLLYGLPVSLFGMAVSAAELPAMSSVVGNGEEVAAALRERLGDGLRRIAFFVVPSAVDVGNPRRISHPPVSCGNRIAADKHALLPNAQPSLSANSRWLSDRFGQQIQRSGLPGKGAAARAKTRAVCLIARAWVSSDVSGSFRMLRMVGAARRLVRPPLE